ncbi:unnamed protein product [Adineta steineri]|uniref:Endonuclease/exonuclease/phosphatase domain-containing protein n=3 Tax=Adineta steineri TaxID=433720 RepID=A0A814SZF0_9BILA|nr:unnamed protein product [Adineta steineri]CAF0728496.1 unnamed protein product [Adineta steineri]CAF0742962.1 unnamed protein product [Adineta steineri]CAF0848077.1 unnamed protein product [Adineta steineri]CAF1154223.1 unnamed protein product [Adineta steineri]
MFTRDLTRISRVMSYNIRMDTPADGENQWVRRRDRVFRLIQYYQPDLIGIQEALPHQIGDLVSAFPIYGWYGVGRDDGKRQGEFSAILYRLDIFERQNQGTFWLSKTPDVPGSKGWDAALPRICSWVLLHDRRTNQKVCHFNTHLDHVGKTARREGARLIASRIHQIAGSKIPTVLTGDFNAGPESDAYRTIVTHSPLRDAKLITKAPHDGPQGTWSTFNARNTIGGRLDYIFVSPQHFQVLHHSHSTYTENQKYPSDHLPVLANIMLQPPKHHLAIKHKPHPKHKHMAP